MCTRLLTLQSAMILFYREAITDTAEITEGNFSSPKALELIAVEDQIFSSLLDI